MVIWSKSAKVDLRAIYDYIAKDSKYYAKKVTQNIRELSLYSYRVIYEIKKQDVFILAVVHKRRNLLSEEIKKT